MSLLLRFRISSPHKQNHYKPLAQGKMCLKDHGSLFCHEICTLSHGKLLVKVIEQKDELPIFHFLFLEQEMWSWWPFLLWQRADFIYSSNKHFLNKYLSCGRCWGCIQGWGSPGRHKHYLYPELPLLYQFAKYFHYHLYRYQSKKQSDKNLFLYTVGTIQVERISEFYSKLDGDKGSRSKRAHRKATGGTKDVYTCTDVRRCEHGLCGKEGGGAQSGRERHLGKSCLGRGQRTGFPERLWP